MVAHFKKFRLHSMRSREDERCEKGKQHLFQWELDTALATCGVPYLIMNNSQNTNLRKGLSDVMEWEIITITPKSCLSRDKRTLHVIKTTKHTPFLVNRNDCLFLTSLGLCPLPQTPRFKKVMKIPNSIFSPLSVSTQSWANLLLSRALPQIT